MTLSIELIPIPIDSWWPIADVTAQLFSRKEIGPSPGSVIYSQPAISLHLKYFYLMNIFSKLESCLFITQEASLSSFMEQFSLYAREHNYVYSVHIRRTTDQMRFICVASFTCSGHMVYIHKAHQSIYMWHKWILIFISGCISTLGEFLKCHIYNILLK